VRGWTILLAHTVGWKGKEVSEKCHSESSTVYETRFLPLSKSVISKFLAERLRKKNAQIDLVQNPSFSTIPSVKTVIKIGIMTKVDKINNNQGNASELRHVYVYFYWYILIIQI
jgi:hypothetical protein